MDKFQLKIDDDCDGSNACVSARLCFCRPPVSGAQAALGEELSSLPSWVDYWDLPPGVMTRPRLHLYVGLTLVHKKSFITFFNEKKLPYFFGSK